jgi:pimeloyl-ACP methyl ester carboxylesterase
VDLLASDVVALIQHAGEQRAHVVGHDWGAAIAWHVAMRFPEHLNQLAILNGPHPKVFAKGFWRPSQLIKSWYMFFFQIPFVPELYTSKRYPNFMRKISTKHYVSKGKLTDREIDVYSEVFNDRNSLRGPINYYRAAFRFPSSSRTQTSVINAKTLVIWGRHDRHLGIRLAEPKSEHVPDCRVEYLNASHWVQQDASSEVNSLLIDFFNTHQG